MSGKRKRSEGDNLSEQQRAVLQKLMRILWPRCLLKDLCLVVFEFVRRQKAYLGAVWMDEVHMSTIEEPYAGAVFMHPLSSSKRVKSYTPPIQVLGHTWSFLQPSSLVNSDVVLQCKAVMVEALQLGHFGWTLSVRIDEPDTIHKWYECQVLIHEKMREVISLEHPEIDPDLILVRPICRSLPSTNAFGQQQPSPIEVAFRWANDVHNTVLAPFYNAAVIHENGPGEDPFSVRPGDPLVIGIRFKRFCFGKLQSDRENNSITAMTRPTLEWVVVLPRS